MTLSKAAHGAAYLYAVVEACGLGLLDARSAGALQWPVRCQPMKPLSVLALPFWLFNPSSSGSRLETFDEPPSAKPPT